MAEEEGGWAVYCCEFNVFMRMLGLANLFYRKLGDWDSTGLHLLTWLAVSGIAASCKDTRFVYLPVLVCTYFGLASAYSVFFLFSCFEFLDSSTRRAVFGRSIVLRFVGFCPVHVFFSGVVICLLFFSSLHLLPWSWYRLSIFHLFAAVISIFTTLQLHMHEFFFLVLNLLSFYIKMLSLEYLIGPW